jgi:hypothetical protein
MFNQKTENKTPANLPLDKNFLATVRATGTTSLGQRQYFESHFRVTHAKMLSLSLPDRHKVAV